MSEERTRSGIDAGGASAVGAGAKARSFVAVPLPPEIQAAIYTAGQGLSARLPEVKWSRKAENLHVTLKFLGQVDRPLLDRLAAALIQALGSYPRFEITLRGLGAFPAPEAAQVLWVGVEDPSSRLTRIAGVVEEVAARLGLAPSPIDDASPSAPGASRAFRAHVTLGRTGRQARGGVDATAVLQPWTDRPFGTVSVREIHLYESITGGDASTYVLRGTATLEGATHGDGQDRDQGPN